MGTLSHVEQLIFWVRDLTGELPPPDERAGIDFRPATIADAPALASAMGPVDGRLARQRFQTNRQVFVGLRGDRVLTYCWLSFQTEGVGEIEGAIRVAPDEAYIWDCQTIPEQRGRGLYPVLLCSIAHFMRERGKRRVWSATTADNHASQRGFEKAGFRRAGILHYRRWLIFRSRRLEIVADLPDEIRRALVAACA